MENIINFQVWNNAKAASRDELKENFKIVENLELVVDATTAYNNAKDKDGFDAKEWMVNYLTKVKKLAPGKGAYIVLDAPVKDTRMKPVKTERIVRKAGSVNMNKAYLIVDTETNTILDQVKTAVDADGKKVFPTKEYAIKRAEDVIVKHGFKGSLAIRKIQACEDDIVATVTYTPSAGTKDGQFIVFGLGQN